MQGRIFLSYLTVQKSAVLLRYAKPDLLLKRTKRFWTSHRMFWGQIFYPPSSSYKKTQSPDGRTAPKLIAPGSSGQRRRQPAEGRGRAGAPRPEERRTKAAGAAPGATASPRRPLLESSAGSMPGEQEELRSGKVSHGPGGAQGTLRPRGEVRVRAPQGGGAGPRCARPRAAGRGTCAVGHVPHGGRHRERGPVRLR